MTADHQPAPAAHVLAAVTAAADAMGHLAEALRTGDHAHLRACHRDLRRAQGHADQLEEDR
ncbi:hypothetical protein Q7689_00570 [Nocardiopsis tropica]|uniref:hypothetical protein n=1 Tax=Nocardiopsis tropica TaxID=109330 RepID=UPI002E867D60|nr:hypothetical protein [Nocardiopsis tropica]